MSLSFFKTIPIAPTARAGFFVWAYCLLMGLVSADLIQISPTWDGTLRDSNGDGVFESIDSSDHYLYTTRFTRFDLRSNLEFSLQGIPAGSTILSAFINYRIVSITNGVSLVSVYTYGADGMASLSDATTNAEFAFSYDPNAFGLSQRQTSLGTNSIQSLVNSSPRTFGLGLRLQANEGTQTSWASNEWGGTFSPFLTIHYMTIPEPFSVSLVGFSAIMLFLSRNARAPGVKL